MIHNDPECRALHWALEAMDSASSYLTLAVAFAREPTVRNDATVLAKAIEAECAALCALLDRHYDREP